MKNHKKLGMCACLFLCVQTYAQTTFEFVSSDLTPQDQGFYTAGATFAWDDATSDFFANGCPHETVNGSVIDPEDYERRDPQNVIYDLHNESLMHGEWELKNVMILPDCNQKYYGVDPVETPAISDGFVQLRPRIDTSNVELLNSYIMSPYISNLSSITIETSADVSINDNLQRYIPYIIEYSKDSGRTFHQYKYIIDRVNKQSGTRTTYSIDDETSGFYRIFKSMVDDSKTSNILLKFTTNYDNALKPDKGQYVNVHKITIVADSAQVFEPLNDDETALAKLDKRNLSLSINDGTISTSVGEISVYRISGQFVGKGSSVFAGKGLFIVTSEEKSFKKKIFIK